MSFYDARFDPYTDDGEPPRPTEERGMEAISGRTRRVNDAFDLLISVCPLREPIALNNRELALSAMSAALASGDADLVDSVSEAVRWAGQDWLLR